MQLLPSSFNKVLSTLRRPSTTSDTKSDITLFNGLPDSEKQEATIKLRKLADQQPQAQYPESRRSFNWKRFLMAFLGLGFLVFAVIASVALAFDVNKDPDLVAKLRMANTNLDRMKLLPKNSDWFFDFTKHDKYTFQPGGVVNANAATFPATTGQGLTMVSLATLGRRTTLTY